MNPSKPIAVHSSILFEGYEDHLATEIVDVIEATNDRPQWVSLECAIKPGSFPKPIIEWVRHTAGDPEDGVMVVVEETDPLANTRRFVDDGHYLILETTSEAITDKEYYCRVTNPEFTPGRAPTTYTFNIGQLLYYKYIHSDIQLQGWQQWFTYYLVLTNYSCSHLLDITIFKYHLW